MKKVLSLVLAFAMILGSFGFVFANQYPDVKDTEYYSEPVNVLSGLGVIGGYPDGTFGTGKSITRAEIATMLINCLGIPVSGQAATSFSDVPASHWASGYIKYAANMGYVAGYPDGTFKPNKSVSYDEAITMIVAALGYTSEGLGGTWPGNFINAARGLGILKICKTTGSAAATREDVCCFLYKALTSPIGRTNKDGEFIATVVDTIPPFNTPVYDTMIDRLGAVDYRGGDPFIVDGSEDSNINLGEYLGAYITAYANEDGEIIAIKEVLSEFIEGEYDAANTKLVGDKTYKTGSAVLANLTDDEDKYTSFKNGDEDATAVDYTTKDGETIKLAVKLNGTKVTKVYSMQIWENPVAKFAKSDVQKLIDKNHTLNGKSFIEDEDGEIDMNSFVLLGRDSLADITEKDVVYVYTNSKDKIVKIEVGTETVEGKITKMPSDNKKVTVANTTYDVSKTPEKPSLGTEMRSTMTGTKVACKFYLDYAGKVFAYKEIEDATDESYGVVLNAWEETVKGKTSYYAEIFLSDGSTKEYELEKLAVFTDADAARGKLVTLTKTSKDVVTVITAKVDDADWEISKNGVVSGPGYKISSSTVVFKFSGGDVDDADNYSVVTASSLFGTKVTSVDFFEDTKSVEAVLIKGSTGEDSDAVAHIVAKGEDTPSGTIYTVLYEGKVQDLNFETGVTVGDFVTLTFDEDGNVTKTGAAPTPTFDKNFDETALAADDTGVDGNVFTAPDGTSYDLTSDIVVYVCDTDNEWRVGSVDDLAASAGDLKGIHFWSHNSDKAFDYALVYEK